jgi:hypothetical protein
VTKTRSRNQCLKKSRWIRRSAMMSVEEHKVWKGSVTSSFLKICVYCGMKSLYGTITCSNCSDDAGFENIK